MGLGGLIIGGLEQDDLIEGLLLQMVFLKTLPMAATGRAMPEQASLALQS